MRLSWMTGSAALLLATMTQAASAQTCPDPADLVGGLEGAMAHVRYLADDALTGRDPGTDGERCAGEYIAAHFAAAGLRPAGMDGSWFQGFELRVGSRLAEGNALAISDGEAGVGKGHTLGNDWTPFGFSPSTDVRAPMSYAGAGITPPDAETVPGTEADLTGRIAVVERLTPGTSPTSLYADPHFKAASLVRRGAVGVIVLLSGDEGLPDPANERRPTVGVPTIAVRGELASRIREAARQGADASLVTAVAPAMATARNVVGLLPGSDPTRSGQVVILGAHYDHLGMGGEGSLEPDLRAIHNGADDNASGTAALIEAARHLAAGPAPARPMLFIAFSGEEKGLLGSAWFTDHPTVPIDDAVAMLNMDMVGRLRDNRLTVFGMATAPEWTSLLEQANGALGGEEALDLALLPDGYGPSDHSEFYAEGIPVLHFFTNTHGDYHRPTDDWQTIEGVGLERIIDLVVEVSRRVGGAADSSVADLTPVEALPPAPAGEDASGGRGYGPYFGSIPDMASALAYGLKLSGVRDDSPAARAGLQAGDVIVRFGDTEITDLYAFTYALRDARPGDRVEVVIERDGQRYTFNAVLGERR